ncbi:hypothetical protein BUALT_Bualt12G0013700 [Buddleja alternifolia]|uniref:Secreted protein n=1 Tax=Buddleja alternifolia TaxID=168488 RepID=A0AAV6WW83_9LAMI|nr:hypothetical protein BUALT_Bualt12G0013700 [Buddleja alternifolia]
MLELFFTVAFSAAPLVLYIPPIRSLNLFVETMEYCLRGGATYALSFSPRLRLVVSRFFSRRLAAARRSHFWSWIEM